MNTIRELKQEEKYNNMLKRKNKEISILKDDKEHLGEFLKESNEEIERLNKERENDIKYNKYLQKELAKSNKIIKEVRDRVIKPSEFIERNERLKLLEILDKEK